MKKNTKQEGAALAISLILLVAMTILGVGTLNGTRLAEKVSSNAQQKAIVFETAESVIDAIAASNDFSSRLTDSLTSNFEPLPEPQDIESAAIANELDQTRGVITSVDVDAAAEIQFCAEMERDGTDLSGDESIDVKIGYHYDLRAAATIDNSRARAEHVLRVESTGVKFGLQGNCPTPGT